MKLHLPKGLRTAVLACFAAFAGIGTTVSTATIVGGTFAITVAGQAMAEDKVISESTEINADNVGEYRGDATDAHNLSITGEGTVVKVTVGGNSGFVDGNVTVGAGAKLQLSVTDTLGYSGDWGRDYTNSIALEDGAEMIVDAVTTLATNINFSGNGSIFSSADAADGARMDGFGGKITATGTNNVISAAIGFRQAFEIEVSGKDDTLTLAGNLSYSAGSTDYSQPFTKSGAGKLIFDSTSTGKTQNVAYGMTVSAGEVVNNTALSVAGTLNIAAGATFTLGADVKLTGKATNKDGVVVLVAGFANAGTLAFTNDATLTLSQDVIEAVLENGGSLGAYTGTVSLAGLEGRQSYSTEGGVITLSSGIVNLTWNGGNGTWTTDGTGWNTATVTDGTASFTSGDSVTFSSTATVALGSNVTVSDMTVAADATLTLTGAQTLDVKDNLTVKGSLALTEGTLTLHDGASIIVAKGQTATINVPTGTEKNDTTQGTYGYWETKGTVWNILSSGKDGDTISEGTVILDGDTGYDAGAGSKRTVYGNYVVTGSFHSSNGGNSLQMNIGSGSSLRVLGTAEFENAQHLTVSGDGSVFSAGKLILGHSSAGSWPASVTAGTGSVVTLQAVQIRSTDDGTFVKLDGGRLNLGEGGFTFDSRVSADAKYFKIVSGTLGSTADSMSYALALTMEGNLTVDTTKQNYDTTTGLTSAGSTGANIGLTGGLTMTEGGKLTVDGTGSLTLGGKVKLTDAIALGANASLAFAENTELDLSGLKAEGNTYTLLTGEGDNRDLRYLKDLAGLHITGVHAVGNLSWEFGENGTLTYTLTGTSSVWAGGDMTWTSTAWTPTSGEPTAYAQDSYVVFSGGETPVASVVTLGENVSASTVVIEKGAAVTLQSTAETANKLTVSSGLELAGELVVKGDVLNVGNTVKVMAAEGAATTARFVMDGYAADDSLLSDFEGNVEVRGKNGALTLSAQREFNSITVADGATLECAPKNDNAGDRTLTLILKGGNVVAPYSNTLHGTIELQSGDNTISIANGYHTSMTSDISGSGNLKLTGGEVALNVRGNINFDGDLVLAPDAAHTEENKKRTINVEKSITNAGSVTVDGAVVYLKSGSSVANTAGGGVNVKAGYLGMETGSSLTTGKLEVSGGTFYAGSGITTLTVTGVNQSGGTVNLDSALTLSGESAAVSLTGGIFATSVAQTLSGPLTLGAVTFGDGQEANNGAVTLGVAGQSIAITGVATNLNALTLIGNFTLSAEVLASLTPDNETGTYTLIRGEAGSSLTLDEGATITVEGYADPLALVKGENGTATFTLPTIAETAVQWLGGDMTWTAATLFAGDTTWAADSDVTFVGGETPVASTVTLGENISVAGVEIQAGAKVTLTSAEGGYKLTAADGISLAGTLIVQGDVLGAGKLTALGDAASFVIDGAAVDYTSQLDGYSGAVTVTGAGGKLTLTAARGFASLTASNGATLYLDSPNYIAFNEYRTITLDGGKIELNGDNLMGTVALGANGGTISALTESGMRQTSVTGTGNLVLDGKVTTVTKEDSSTSTSGQLALTGANIETTGNVSITNKVTIGKWDSWLGDQGSVARILNGGDVNIESGATVSLEKGSAIGNGGTLNVAHGGTLTAVSGATISTGAATVNGTLNLSTAITTSNADFALTVGEKGVINVTLDNWADAYKTSSYSEGDGNGFANTTYTLVSNTSTADTLNTFVTNGAKVNGLYDLDVSDDKRAVTFATSAGTDYYVTTGETAYSAIAGTKAQAIALNGGTLSVASTDTASLEAKLLKSSTLSLGADASFMASLITSAASDATLTLNGSGTYNVQDASKLGCVTLDSGWAGTISLQGVSVTAFDVDSVGNANSTVEFKGVTGYLSQANTEAGGVTYAANIKLTNSTIADDPSTTDVDESATLAALTLNNGWEKDKRTFSGKVSGTGDIMRVGQGGTSSWGKEQSYTFSGDVSEWNGSFIHDFDISETASDKKNGVTSTVTFSGDATVINAGMKHVAGNALAVIIDNTAAVTMNGFISGNTNLTSKGSGEKTLTAANTATGLLTVEAGTVKIGDGAAWAGTVSVANGATLYLLGTGSTGAITNNGTVQLGDGASIAGLTSGALKVDGDATASSSADVSVDSLTNSGTLNLGRNNLTLTAANAQGGIVKANTVTLAADSAFNSLEVALLQSGSEEQPVKVTLVGTADSSIESIGSTVSLVVGGSTVSLGKAGSTVTLDSLQLAEASLVSVTGNLQVAGKVSSLETIPAGAVAVTGDSGIKAAGDISVDGTVTLGGSLMAGAASTVELGGAENSIGGLTYGDPTDSTENKAGVLTLAGALDVDGGITGLSTINVSTPFLTTTTNAVTAESLTVGTDGMLVVNFTSASNLTHLVLSEGEGLGLLVVDGTDSTLTSLAGKLALQIGGEGEGATWVHGATTYTLALDANGTSVVLTAVTQNANSWDGTDTNSSWTSGSDADSGFSQTTSESSNVIFGASAANKVVDVNGAAVSNTITVSSNYTFQKEADAAYAKVSTGELHVSAGILTVENGVTVDVSTVEGDESSGITATQGELVIGAANTAAEAGVSVAPGGRLEADTMTIYSANGLTNAGTVKVDGAVVAEDLAIANTGDFSMGDGSQVGSIAGTDVGGAPQGTVTATGWADVGTITAETVTASGSGNFTVESVDVGTEEVTLAAKDGGFLAVGTVQAKSVCVDLANTSGFANNALQVDNGYLTVSDIATGSTGDVTVSDADGGLKLSTTGGAAVDAAGVNVIAQSLDLSDITAAGTTLGNVMTNAITLDITDLAACEKTTGVALLTIAGRLAEPGTRAIGFGTNDGKITLTLDDIPADITSLDAADAKDALAYASAFQADKTYTLISTQAIGGKGQAVEIVLDELAQQNLTQLFALNGLVASFGTSAANNYEMTLVAKDTVSDLLGGAMSDPYYEEGATKNTVLLLNGVIQDDGDDTTQDPAALAVAKYDSLNHVDDVKMMGDATIDLTDEAMTDLTDTSRGLTIRNLDSVNAGGLTLKGGLATLINDTATNLDGGLTAQDGMIVQVEATADAGKLTVGDVTLTNGSMLAVLAGGSLFTDNLLTPEDESSPYGAEMVAGAVTLEGGSSLIVEDAADGAEESAKASLTVKSLNSADTLSSVSGKVTVAETPVDAPGYYQGQYNDATVELGTGAYQTLVLHKTPENAPAPEVNKLSVTSAAGATEARVTLDYTAGNADIDTIDVTNAQVTLANGGTNTVTLANASTITGGELIISTKAADIIAGVNEGTAAPAITAGEGLTVTDSKVTVWQADPTVTSATFDLSKGTEGITIANVTENGTLNTDNVELEDTAFFNRYFKNERAEGGKIVADLYTDYYSQNGITENGTAGLEMAGMAFLGGVDPDGDMADIISSLEDPAVGAAARDNLGAALAGSGLASLGMAISGDVERQLKAIRNRTTTMGVDPAVVNEDMPYFNAWINAEGDHRSMDEDSTLAGYTLSSWGGTVGFDVDANPSLTFGLAVTAMYGDFSSESVDTVEGDVDTYYISAFARAMSGAWVHTFVATVGMNETELERTVTHAHGSYKTKGDTEGMSFGFLYEVGRTFALNEDATACWQPVFNVAYRHIEVDGYTETGSDAALEVGDQSMDVVTFGLGARVQSVVGENLYNRTSVFEARALVKLDAGDRESEMDTALISTSAASATVKSAEMDAFGLELGAGITVPVGMESGSIFVDGSFEFRGCYTSANATLGYRVNF